MLPAQSYYELDYDGPPRRRIKVNEVECIIDIDRYISDGSQTLQEQWIRPAEGILLAYRITSSASFRHLKNYLELYQKVKERQISNECCPIVLVGTKCDLGDGQEREVERKEGEHLASLLKCNFREASAKTREDIEEVIVDIVRKLREIQSKKNKKLAMEEEGIQKPRRGFKL